MKIVTCKQMAEMESLSYKGGASESDFMEEAGSGVALLVHDFVEKHGCDRTVILLCGKGNNGGDAYVAGIHLLHLDYQVFAVQVDPISDCSSLCKQNYQRFVNEGGRDADSLNEFPRTGIIVDGLFGTGFHGIAQEPYAALIALANHSGLPIIAIDIPSGLNGDTGDVEGEAIIADETAFLGLPKRGFFLNSGWNHVGKLHHVDFGMPEECIDHVETNLIMLSEDQIYPLLPQIKRSRHKYEAGHVIGLAGSPNMPGAAILASAAALRGGAGIIHLAYPKGMEAELASCPFEVIKMPMLFDRPEEILEMINKGDSAFIGPGLGRTGEVAKLLHYLLPRITVPCVIDADALFFLSREKCELPNQAILTPHRGEMTRLLKNTPTPSSDEELLKLCHAYAVEKNITLILKGAPTFIIYSGEPILVNPTGDPGMATAGSGDVLTGLLAALLAQGLSCRAAAALGVFLHGRAGEIAAEDLTSYSVCASDLVDYFPSAFKTLMI